MGGIDGETRIHGDFELAVKGTGHRLRALPKHAVVNDQEPRPAFCRGLDDGKRGIHRRHDSSDLSGVGQLQAVHRTRIIRD